MAGLKGSIKSDSLQSKLSTKKVSVSIGGNVATMSDHSALTNLDFLHSGHTGFAGIEIDTTIHWNAKPEYRPANGVLIVYSDYKTYTNEQGQEVVVPGFKIGDGNAYLIDKPFVGEADSKILQQHIEDAGLHIQPGERAFWNNKLNYVEPEDDCLEFTRF